MYVYACMILSSFVPELGCGSTATSELVQGVLLALQQMFSVMSHTKPPISVLMQVRRCTHIT